MSLSRPGGLKIHISTCALTNLEIRIVLCRRPPNQCSGAKGGNMAVCGPHPGQCLCETCDENPQCYVSSFLFLFRLSYLQVFAALKALSYKMVFLPEMLAQGGAFANYALLRVIACLLPELLR